MGQQAGTKHYLHHENLCDVCGIRFSVSRKDAKYCSNKCRVKASRQRQADKLRWTDLLYTQAWLHEMLKQGRKLRLTDEQIRELKAVAKFAEGVANMAIENKG